MRDFILFAIVIPIVILVWELVHQRAKEDERRELVKAIREEFKGLRDDILEEIRSLPANK